VSRNTKNIARIILHAGEDHVLNAHLRVKLAMQIICADIQRVKTWLFDLVVVYLRKVGCCLFKQVKSNRFLQSALSAKHLIPLDQVFCTRCMLCQLQTWRCQLTPLPRQTI